MPASGPDTHADKDRLRSRLIFERRTEAVSSELSAARTARCLAACAGHQAVACYGSVGDEPDTWGLIAGLSTVGVRVLLPVLAGRRHPDWAWYDGPDALAPGRHGILEPTGVPLGPAAVAEVTFVWASALAATPTGARLGTGGGWYDRALAHARPEATVGVLLGDAEVLDAVPMHEWDRHVDVIVTPTRTLWTGVRAREYPPVPPR